MSAELNKLRVVDLKGQLNQAGLSTSGRKADLVERLLKYRSSESESEPQEEPEPMQLDEPQDEQPLKEAQFQQQEEPEHPPQEAPPSPQEAPPSPQDAPPSPQEAPPSPQEAPSPPQGAPSPPQDAPSPPQEAPSPPQDAPSPPQEAPSPPQEAPSPIEDAPSPPPEAPSPIEDAPSPLQEAPSPIEDAPSPPPEAPSPIEDAPSPLQDAPSPPQEAPSSPSNKVLSEPVVNPLEKTKKPQEGTKVSSLEELDARTNLEKIKLEVLNNLKEEGEKMDPLKIRQMLKNKKKRMKKKKRKESKQEKGEADAQTTEKVEDIEVEYVTQDPDFNDPNLFMFRKIFRAFQIVDEVAALKEEVTSVAVKEIKPEKIKNFGEDSSDEEQQDDKERISKKKLRKLNRLSVAELKQLVIRPDVVEMHDVTAQDPRLLVHLKATRNSVIVPRHWCFKRKYLQGKRGFEKPAFELPECIKNTGIMEMRQALQEKEDSRTLKSKVREKVRPKLGKIDIDYQKLHDAFFRYQTKPRMTSHGDLYYEGKEFETRLKEKKPGNLSDDLRQALGMPVGAGATKIPPPWLIAMQRYGPPPSYPNLKIQGLNCPIPESCSFGYHAGGWGKPPVDEHGRPLYGDVFGTQGTEFDEGHHDDNIDRSLWGDLESESEESSSEEEEEEGDETGIMTPAGESGVATPSGISTVPTGMETPDMIELRKRKIEDQMEGGETPQLFQVLPEKSGSLGARAMMGSAHTYEVPARDGVDVALNPEELELDSVAMAAKYEARVREQEDVEKEDFSDMVADHAAKQKKKRKSQVQDNKPTKKYKEFKF